MRLGDMGMALIILGVVALIVGALVGIPLIAFGGYGLIATAPFLCILALTLEDFPKSTIRKL